MSDLSVQDIDLKWEEYSDHLANNRLTLVETLKLVSQHTLEKIAQKCSEFCDCPCCARALRGLEEGK